MITVHTAAQIVTMNERLPIARAVAVRDDRIVAVGELDEVLAAIGDQPFEINDSLADRVILPGLIDQHLHPVLGATTLATEVVATEDWVLPDRTFPAAHSPGEYVARLTDAADRIAAEDPTGADWLFSWGYHELWHGELSREILDSISDTRPIGVWQRSCHEFYLNTPALRAVGLLDRDLGTEVADGTLDAGVAATSDVARGHFWERGMFVLVFPLVTPMLFEPTRFARGLRQMVQYLHQNGVTAFNEPGAILVPGAWELYEQILGDEDTPFASYFIADGRGPAESGMPREETLARAERQIARAPSGKVSFFDKQVKLFADGAIISQLMQMQDPYLDRDGAPNPDHHGEWILAPEVLEERTRWYWEEGFQIHIHVNGDAGLEVVLDTIERRMAEHPRPDHRTVIVHFANSTEAQIDRIARLGCVVSSNPYYPVGFADKFGEVGLGPARADVMTRHRSVLDRRIPLSFHSDLPMGRSDPIGMMSCAVNRVTPSGRVAGPEQRITIAEALRAVTIDAAHSWQREHELGSIEPGKVANFTVVDANPLDVDPDDLDDIDVVGTFFDGLWFPVPTGMSRRSTGSISVAPTIAIESARGHDHSGCICAVAREMERALQRSFDAA